MSTTRSFPPCETSSTTSLTVVSRCNIRIQVRLEAVEGQPAVEFLLTSLPGVSYEALSRKIISCATHLAPNDSDDNDDSSSSNSSNNTNVDSYVVSRLKYYNPRAPKPNWWVTVDSTEIIERAIADVRSMEQNVLYMSASVIEKLPCTGRGGASKTAAAASNDAASHAQASLADASNADASLLMEHPVAVTPSPSTLLPIEFVSIEASTIPRPTVVNEDNQKPSAMTEKKNSTVPSPNCDDNVPPPPCDDNSSEFPPLTKRRKTARASLQRHPCTEPSSGIDVAASPDVVSSFAATTAASVSLPTAATAANPAAADATTSFATSRSRDCRNRQRSLTDEKQETTPQLSDNESDQDDDKSYQYESETDDGEVSIGSVGATITTGATKHTMQILVSMSELLAMGIPAPREDIIAYMSGHLNKSTKSFSAALQALTTGGCLDRDNKKCFRLTEMGLSKVGPAVNYPKTNEEFHRRIKKVFRHANFTKIFDILADGRVHPLKDVAAAVGYTNIHTKSFAKAVSQMKQRDFVKELNESSRGGKVLQLTDTFFPFGRTWSGSSLTACFPRLPAQS